MVSIVLTVGFIGSCWLFTSAIAIGARVGMRAMKPLVSIRQKPGGD